MPVRVIGMIGVAPPSGEATVHIIKGGISPPYLKSYAQAHDKAGFDLVTGPAHAKFLEAAAESKLKVLMSSSALSGDQRRIDSEIQSFDGHRAAWGWYLIDEPDFHDVPPERAIGGQYDVICFKLRSQDFAVEAGVFEDGKLRREAGAL